MAEIESLRMPTQAMMEQAQADKLLNRTQEALIKLIKSCQHKIRLVKFMLLSILVAQWNKLSEQFKAKMI